MPAARSSTVGLRLAWGGAVIDRSAETEDTAVARIRQYKRCKRQYSAVVCVSAYRLCAGIYAMCSAIDLTHMAWRQAASASSSSSSLGHVVAGSSLHPAVQVARCRASSSACVAGFAGCRASSSTCAAGFAVVATCHIWLLPSSELLRFVPLAANE